MSELEPEPLPPAPEVEFIGPLPWPENRCPVCWTLVSSVLPHVRVHFANVADQRPCPGSYRNRPNARRR